MSTKTPSAVLAYTAVPDDAADPVVKTVVNGVETESGGGNELMKVTINIVEGTDTFDKTYAEIANALDNGVFVYIVRSGAAEGFTYTEVFTVTSYGHADDNSVFTVYADETIYSTDSADGYPAFTLGG